MEHKIVVNIRQLPSFTSNFAETKEQIGSYLKEFEFVVTEDDCKFAKEKATELNRLADTLDALRKNKIKEISAPIAAFDTEAKEIHALIKQTRQSLVDQYTKFDEKRKEQLRAMLATEVQNLWKLHGVEKEFQRATFEDLVILSNMTSTGKIVKKADDAITNRVLADKQLQEKISARLMVLEGESLKAGLMSPLGRHNVNHFLFSDNYDDQLKSLIAVELKRQIETEARLEKQLEAKQKLQNDVNHQLAENERVSAQIQTNLEIKKAMASSQDSSTLTSTQKPANTNDGDMRYTITVTMELVMGDMDVEKLEAATLRKFASAGFQSVKDVNIQKVAVGKPNTQPQNMGLLADGSLF